MRVSITSLWNFVKITLAGAVFLTLAGAAAHAQVTTNGCGDATSDFGEDCSLAELYADPANNYIQVGNTRFGHLSGPNPPDANTKPYNRSLVRVVGLDDIANQPGVRLEFAAGDFTPEFADGFPIAAFINMVAETAPGAPSQEFTWLGGNFSSIIDSKSGTTDLNYSGGCAGVAFNATDVFLPSYIPGPLLEGEDTNVPDIACAAAVNPPPVDFSYAAQTDVVGIGLTLTAKVLDADPNDGFEGYAEITSVEVRVGIGGPPPPPNVANSNMIADGFFENGLDFWNTSGVVSVVAGPAVDMTSDTDATGTAEITQLIDTPNGSYMLFFDYQFTTPNGVLQVFVNDSVVANIPAPAEVSSIFERAEILVNDTALMGLSSAELKIQLNPGSLANALIANLLSPLFNLAPSGFARGLVHDSTQCPGLGIPQIIDTGNKDVGIVAMAESSQSDGTETSASATQAVSSPFGGVQFGIRASAHAITNEACAGADAQAVSKFSVLGSPPFPPAGVDFIFNLTGTMDLEGDFPTAASTANIFLTSVFSVKTPRAMQDVNLEILLNPASETVEDVIVSASPLEMEQNALSGITIQSVQDLGVTVSKQLEIAIVHEFGDLLFAEVGDQVEILVTRSELTTRSSPQFNGTATGDFFNTFEGTLSSDTPNTELVPDNGENQPPTADAGVDQTVEATSPAGADVTLDGSGSSDPDGDELEYSWSEGGSEIATGVSPVVAFALGSYTVTLEVDDSSGGSNTDDVVIVVEDTTPPSISAPADVTVTEGDPIDLGTPVVSDLVDPAPTVGNDAPGVFSLGTTTVVWTATDASGNAATANQLVTVNADSDTVPPSITAPADITVVATGALTAVDLGTPTVSDNQDPSPTVTNDAPAGGFPVGNTTVVWTATDAAGNSASATQTVTVLYVFGAFLPPLVEDETYKANRTLPVKFQLFYSDGTPVADATITIEVVQVGANAGEDLPVDLSTDEAADTDNVFRYDETDGQYNYNLSTKGFDPGTYRISAILSNGQTESIEIVLK